MSKSAVTVLALCVWAGARTDGFQAAWVSFDGTTEPTPPTVHVGDASPAGVTLDITVHGMLVMDTVVAGVSYHVLAFPGEGAMSDVGFPQLPQVTRLVGHAPEAAVSVDVSCDDTLVLGGYNVYPAQEPVFEPGCSPSFDVNQALYSRDAWFPDPSESAPAVNLGVWRDLSVVVAVARPVVFNPVRQQLRVFRSLTVTFGFAGGAPLPSAVLPDTGGCTPTRWPTTAAWGSGSWWKPRRTSTSS